MHTHAAHARKAPPPHQTDITATWPTQLSKCSILSTCVGYYVRPVNVSATLSGESNRDVILTWEEPPGYEDIIGVWYRVRLYSYSYSYSYSYVTTLNNVFSWLRPCSSTYLLCLSESGICPFRTPLQQCDGVSTKVTVGWYTRGYS